MNKLCVSKSADETIINIKIYFNLAMCEQLTVQAIRKEF